MADLHDIDTSNAEALRDGYTPVPPGDYTLLMESSDIEDAKTEGNKFLKCVFNIIGCEYEGAKIIVRFNFWNSNQKAVDIAKSQWRALCEATLGQPNALNGDSSSLHNKIFIGEVSNVARADGKQNAAGQVMRNNELVFNKGSIRSANDVGNRPPVGSTAAAAKAAAAPSSAPPAKAAPAQAAAPAAAAPVPGQGKAPWKK